MAAPGCLMVRLQIRVHVCERCMCVCVNAECVCILGVIVCVCVLLCLVSLKKLLPVTHCCFCSALLVLVWFLKSQCSSFSLSVVPLVLTRFRLFRLVAQCLGRVLLVLARV